MVLAAEALAKAGRARSPAAKTTRGWDILSVIHAKVGCRWALEAVRWGVPWAGCAALVWRQLGEMPAAPLELAPRGPVGEFHLVAVEPGFPSRRCWG